MPRMIPNSRYHRKNDARFWGANFSSLCELQILAARPGDAAASTPIHMLITLTNRFSDMLCRSWLFGKTSLGGRQHIVIVSHPDI
jgi:hypothetical protein